MGLLSSRCQLRIPDEIDNGIISKTNSQSWRIIREDEETREIAELVEFEINAHRTTSRPFPTNKMMFR
ncbi:unnamed protein product [Rodentolepis nana]|uniref:Uncharacterized protein n=1 Tax=Rodentolepis nana TaxID=102285 RepID=A0A3P7SVD4_RODNA|nr:unnamed protein product [Rodentolepis nana]